MVLLKIISAYDPSIPILFLNTGYHLSETLLYRDQLRKLFNLNLINLYSDVPKHIQRDQDNRLLYTYDSDFCCQLNKILPMVKTVADYDVWVSGIRKVQTETRSKFNFEETRDDGIIRFHPILDWTDEDMKSFISSHNLPKHPLDSDGLKKYWILSLHFHSYRP